MNGFHKLLATMIVVVMGAGVVAIIVKNDRTTSTASPPPRTSVVETPTPNTTVQAPQQTGAPKSSVRMKHLDELSNVPPLPITGVAARYPIGFVLVFAAGAVALWLRRVAGA